MMRRVARRAAAQLIAWLTRPVGARSLARVLGFAAQSAVRGRQADESLRCLLDLEQQLFFFTGSEAVRYGQGVHTKHRHTGYHDFFCQRLAPGERVIDIGCGNGALARDMGAAGARVTGIDMSAENIAAARARFAHDNVTYVHGDVLDGLPGGGIDTAVMSNVLEHIEGRVEFLQRAQAALRPRRWLLRVPMYERDWRVPLMEELGIDYRLDSTHFIEYRQEEFLAEIGRAGLEVTELQIRWGEFWVEARAKV